MARRQHLTLTVLLAAIVFFSITYLFSGSSSSIRHVAPLNAGRGDDAHQQAGIPAAAVQKSTAAPAPPSEPKSDFAIDLDAMPNLSAGDPIAPRLENATLKYVGFPHAPMTLPVAAPHGYRSRPGH